jgi:hypothetical protein
MCGNRFIFDSQLRLRKRKPPAIPKRNSGRDKILQLSFLFLLRGEGLLGGLRLGGALLEFIHASGGIHELLLACVTRVAHVADADDDDGLG